MKTYLTSHLEDEKDVSEFKYAASGSKIVLERLVQLLNEERAELLKKSRKLSGYESPSWAMQQADYIGSDRTLLSCLTKLEDLLEVSS